MPVTLNVAKHHPRKWEERHVPSAKALLQQSCKGEGEKSKRIIQSSVSQRLFDESHISASKNGFVWAAINAYSGHHHLVIRPEEVWFAILSQTSFYINAHAEELRDYFVAHQGKKELWVEDVGTIDTVDFGRLAQCMGDLIQENVKDPDLQTWIIPDWTTTTDNDRTTAAILMMGSMQKYFSYGMRCTCGVPSVTLLGARDDWEDMLRRLDKLDKLGDEPAAFASLLRPVLRHFVLTFDAEPTAAVLSFWDRIAHLDSRLSGHTFLDGWITAFCFWSVEGKRLYTGSLLGEPDEHWHKEFTQHGGLVLDGVHYHVLDTENVPAGYASVPVKVDDNGVIYNTTMVAGLIGMQVSSSGAMLDGGETWRHDDKGLFERDEHGNMVPVKYVPAEPTAMPALDTLQPLAGWFMYEMKSDAQKKAEEDEQKRKDEEGMRDMERLIKGVEEGK